MKIYLVRHGETDFNKEGKAMGQRMDKPLNTEGRKQAEQLAENLVGDDFDIIFTSPLKRAEETAKIIARKIKAPVIEKEELLERDYGSLSGKKWREMKEEHKLDFEAIDLEQKYDYRPFGGENVKDVEKRLLKFMKELKENYSDKKILVVAHGGIIKLAHLLFKEEKMDKTPDNATVHEFEI